MRLGTPDSTTFVQAPVTPPRSARRWAAPEARTR